MPLLYDSMHKDNAMNLAMTAILLSTRLVRWNKLEQKIWVRFLPNASWADRIGVLGPTDLALSITQVQLGSTETY